MIKISFDDLSVLSIKREKLIEHCKFFNEFNEDHINASDFPFSSSELFQFFTMVKYYPWVLDWEKKFDEKILEFFAFNSLDINNYFIRSGRETDFEDRYIEQVKIVQMSDNSLTVSVQYLNSTDTLDDVYEKQEILEHLLSKCCELNVNVCLTLKIESCANTDIPIIKTFYIPNGIALKELTFKFVSDSYPMDSPETDNIELLREIVYNPGTLVKFDTIPLFLNEHSKIPARRNVHIRIIFAINGDEFVSVCSVCGINTKNILTCPKCKQSYCIGHFYPSSSSNLCIFCRRK